jgi:hypothetical protein
MTFPFFANILLSADFPMGRSKGTSRKKADWFHSISVFTEKSIYDMNMVSEPQKCTIIHFFGSAGSPVLQVTKSKIWCYNIHQGQKLYKIKQWGDSSYGKIGDVRTSIGYEPGYGRATTSIDNIIYASNKKWGNQKIPYAHQRNESYNCVAFVDDILSWAKNQKWNKRIKVNHLKYGLYL